MNKFTQYAAQASREGRIAAAAVVVVVVAVLPAINTARSTYGS
jgi:hypothetical protein